MKTLIRNPFTKFSAINLNRCFIQRVAIPVSAIAISLMHSTVHAGNTWDGGGGDDNWGTGNNWNPDGSPSPGTGNDLFFAGSTRLSPFNNYGAFDDWRNITFNSGASSFNLFGNAIDLFGKIENLSSNSQSVSFLSIALNSSSAIEFNPVNGNLTIFSTNIFTNGNQLKVFGNNGFTLAFSSGTNIQGTGSLAINQNSTVIYNSAHSYTGDTFINAGKLQFASGGSAANSTIRIGDTSGTIGAEFGLTAASGGQSLANTIVSRPGGSGYAARTIASQNTSGTNSLTGVIALDAALTIKQAAGGTLNLTGSFFDVKQQVLTVNSDGAVDISKPLNSSSATGGSLIKQGSGTLTLSNVSNNYTGTNSGSLNANGTQIAGGTLAIAADTSLGLAPAGAYNNVQFTGTGTLRSDGNISLNSNRNVSITSGATVTLDSNGNTFTINGIINGSGGAVTKAGAGTVVLTTNNSYTGATNVSAGGLTVTGTIHTSSGVTVATGANLAGESSDSGVATGRVSAITLSGGAGTGGILAPGNGSGGDLGTLYGTSLSWNGSTTTAFSQMQFDLGAANASDRLILSGAMTKGTGSIFEWDFGDTGVINNTYTLVTALGGFGSGPNLFNASDFTFKSGSLTSGLTGSFSISGNNLNFSVVPEPTSALAGLLLGAGLLRRRRV